jgi:hypothetical protein
VRSLFNVGAPLDWGSASLATEVTLFAHDERRNALVSCHRRRNVILPMSRRMVNVRSVFGAIINGEQCANDLAGFRAAQFATAVHVSAHLPSLTIHVVSSTLADGVAQLSGSSMAIICGGRQ